MNDPCSGRGGGAAVAERQLVPKVGQRLELRILGGNLEALPRLPQPVWSGCLNGRRLKQPKARKGITCALAGALFLVLGGPVLPNLAGRAVLRCQLFDCSQLLNRPGSGRMA